MKTLIFTFVLLFFSCLNFEIAFAQNASCADCRNIPVKKIGLLVVDELKKSMPEDACKEGGFMNVCFNVDYNTCISDATTYFNECSEKIERELENETQTIECRSREHCSEQGSVIGKVIGKKIGTCGGEKFAQKHCEHFKMNECIDWLRSAGAPKEEIDQFINAMKKFSI
jgi:hypothetical protein